MIIFGQGAIRCHPWLLKEMLALEEPDAEKALTAFDESFWAHVRHGRQTLLRAWSRSWSGGLLGPAPEVGEVRKYYRRLGRYAAGFALLADTALLLLGGGLKRREMLSARLGDVLSELYLLSAVLKRWQDEGEQSADLPLVAYTMQSGFATIENRLSGVLNNLPNRFAAFLVRLVILPLGIRQQGPVDALTRRCAEILLAPSETRDRLTAGLFLERGANGSVADLERAFDLVVQTEPLEKRLADARCRDRQKTLALGLLSLRGPLISYKSCKTRNTMLVSKVNLKEMPISKQVRRPTWHVSVYHLCSLSLRHIDLNPSGSELMSTRDPITALY
jgi:acyl-CoA dehydrogenase